MIYLYYGKIGDGKTYHVVVNELLPAVRAGRKVYTNIDGLNKKHIAMLTDKLEHEINIIHVEHPDAIKDLMFLDSNDKEGKSLKLEKGSIVIIDEAQMIWDAREFKDTKKGFLNLLEYHRHFGLDFVFITQNPKRLEVSITRLSNESYHVKNLRFLGSFLGNRYVIHIRQTPHDRDIVSTIRGRYRSEIFLCYRSAVATSKHKKKTKGAMQGFFYYATVIVIIFSISIYVIKGGFTFANPNRVASMTPQAANINTGGVNNVGNDVQSFDFIYDSNPYPKHMAVSEKEIRADIVISPVVAVEKEISDCVKYSNFSGKGFVRVGNSVLYLTESGVWRNKTIACGFDSSAKESVEQGSQRL